MNCFARSRPCGSWTREECLSTARQTWMSEVSLNGAVQIEIYNRWVKEFPYSSAPQKQKISPEVVCLNLKSEHRDAPTIALELKATPTPSVSSSKTVDNKCLQELLTIWEINAEKWLRLLKERNSKF